MTKTMHVSRLFLLAGFLFLYSCKKNSSEGNEMEQTKPSASLSADASIITNQIKEAERFFKTEVESAGSGKIEKKPLWGQAYIAHTAKGDKVIVPLDFINCNSFTTNFSGDKKFSPNEQIHLEIYKDQGGKFRAQAVSILPNQAYLEKREERFSGYVLAEDWNGENLHKCFYKNGERASPDWNNLRTTLYCTYLSFYLCNDDYSHCTLQWRVLIGCDDNEGLEWSDGGGGGEDIEDLIMERAVRWVAKEDEWCKVFVSDIIKGAKNFSNPSPAHNYFISVTKAGSYLDNFWSFYDDDYTSIGPVTYGYSEDGHSTLNTLQSASSTISGHYSRQDVTQDLHPIGGSIFTPSVQKSKSWIFKDVF